MVPDNPVRRRLDLTDPATVKAVARRVELGAKRRLGQHFLVDDEVRVSIIEALAPNLTDSVMEVGVGMGTLTQALAPLCGTVVGIEIDPACVRATKITLRQFANVRVVLADVMHCQPGELGLGGDFLACGNLPYNLTTALLGRLLEAAQPPRRSVFLVQREVAARLAAPPGHWSLATVAIRSLAGVERIRDVAPESFLPAPAVWSSIIRLTPEPIMVEEERRLVLSLARAAFQLRRKTLRHGIANALGGDLAVAEQVLAEARVDARRRPETLDLDEWRVLAAAIPAP